jgi:hypothetical protein
MITIIEKSVNDVTMIIGIIISELERHIYFRQSKNLRNR